MVGHLPVPWRLRVRPASRALAAAAMIAAIALVPILAAGQRSAAATAAEDRVVQLLPDPSIPNIVAFMPKWDRVRLWLASDQATADPTLAGWVAWARSLSARPYAERVAQIEARVNASFAYRTDQQLFGVRDYWELPYEVVKLGAADCDRFAIFKLWLARLAGISDGNLAMVVGTLSATGRMHAALFVAGNDHDDVLDFLQGKVVSDETYFVGFRPLVLLTLDDMHIFVARWSRLR
jgi:predicted transglutaminase-like cysteine proteinase